MESVLTKQMPIDTRGTLELIMQNCDRDTYGQVFLLLSSISNPNDFYNFNNIVKIIDWISKGVMKPKCLAYINRFLREISNTQIQDLYFEGQEKISYHAQLPFIKDNSSSFDPNYVPKKFIPLNKFLGGNAQSIEWYKFISANNGAVDIDLAFDKSKEIGYNWKYVEQECAGKFRDEGYITTSLSGYLAYHMWDVNLSKWVPMVYGETVKNN